MGTQSSYTSNSNKSSFKTLLKSILILISIIVIWKILSLGIGQWYEQQISDNNDAVAKSLAWTPDSPSVLYRASQLNPNENKDKISELLKRSLNGNLSDGRVLITLGKLFFSQNNISLADDIVNQATINLPNDAYTHIEASSYWLRRNKLDKAIQSWNVALQTTPGLRSRIFPLLLSWIEDSSMSKALNKALNVVVNSPPVWWQEFFQYAAKNASRINTLDKLYYLRRQSPVTISQQERGAYIKRLQNEYLWSEAFLVWLNGLGPQGLKYMGQPYNGSFETTITHSGFGWNFNEVSGVLVETEHTFGNNGQQALHVVFQGKYRSYKHLYQTLFLVPAQYRLTGLVRPESLVSTGGLRWKIRCLTNSREQKQLTGVQKTLGESERFLGVGQWRKFLIEFEIPDSNCMAQDLRLESEDQRRGNDIISGEIWFDSFAIERI